MYSEGSICPCTEVQDLVSFGTREEDAMSSTDSVPGAWSEAPMDDPSSDPSWCGTSEYPLGCLGWDGPGMVSPQTAYEEVNGWLLSACGPPISCPRCYSFWSYMTSSPGHGAPLTQPKPMTREFTSYSWSKDIWSHSKQTNKNTMAANRTYHLCRWCNKEQD